MIPTGLDITMHHNNVDEKVQQTKIVVDENSSRRKSAVDELTIYCIVDEMTVDELTVDELTLDDLTWYPLFDNKHFRPGGLLNQHPRV